MDSKSEQTTRADEAEKVVTNPVRIGVYDFTDGSVSLTNFLQPRFCRELNHQLYPNTTATLIDASGGSATDANGKKVFLLSEFVCFFGTLADPIHVLATARTTTPVFVTAVHTLIRHDADLQITVMAWNAQGAPVPGVSFDWRCRVIHLPTGFGPPK